MLRLGLLTTRFLDLSETFIFEPLRLLKDSEIFVYAWQRRNAENFPYDQINTWDDLSPEKIKHNRFWNNFGKEEYLLHCMRRDNIQLLHAHYGYMGITALQYQRKLKIPLVTSFYGLDVYQHTRNPIYRWQLKKLFDRGEMFLVCSKKMREDLLKLGAIPSRTRVLYGGAELSKFPYSYKPLPEKGPIIILMCGRFVEKKGFIYGVKAFLDAARHNEDLQLKIIGSGKEENTLKQLVKDSHFGRQVEFLGNKNHAEYIEAIKDCHVFMSPSVIAENGDSEGLPTVLIETAAIGRPLLATRHSGIPEIVHDGKNGLLCAEKDVQGLTDNILKLIQDSHLWRKYSEYGRRLVEEQFNLQTQVNKLEQYYRELL